MARGNIIGLHPPKNTGNRHGAGQITEEGTGKKYVFHTPDDVDPNVPLSVGMVVTFDPAANGNGVSNVRVAVPDPTCTLTANPLGISKGVGQQYTTLSWTSTNAVTAFIDNGIGNVSPVAGGSVNTADLTTTTTFTLTVTNSAGIPCKASVQISLSQPGPTPPPQ